MTVPRRFPARHAVALGILVALPYLSTLRNGFVWDDLLQIAGNPLIAHFAEVTRYFVRLEGMYYRPAVFFTYMLDHAVWRDLAAGFHVTNLLLHVAIAIGVAHLAVRTGLSIWAAWVAALVFALHPLQTEAVAYVSGRTDLLMTAAALLSWRLLLRGGSALQRGMLAAGVAAVSMLSKESGFALALFLPWVAYRVERGWRQRAALMLPVLCTATAVVLLRPGTLPAFGTIEGPSWGAGMAKTVVTYASLLLWPAQLQIDRLTSVSVSGMPAALSLAVLATAVGLSVWGLSRPGGVGDWTAWSVAFYLPVANVIPLYPAIAARAVFTPEHNFYAPLAGLAVLIGVGADRVRLRLGAGTHSILMVVGVILLGALAFRSAVRTFDWHDEERLFSSATLAGTISPRVWYNLGNVRLQRGAAAEAETAFRHGSELAPHDADMWMNLGVALQKQGALDEALTAYHQAEGLTPESALVFENLGTLYLARDDLAAARDALVRALQLDPRRQKAAAALRAVEQRLVIAPGSRPTVPLR